MMKYLRRLIRYVLVGDILLEEEIHAQELGVSDFRVKMWERIMESHDTVKVALNGWTRSADTGLTAIKEHQAFLAGLREGKGGRFQRYFLENREDDEQPYVDWLEQEFTHHIRQLLTHHVTKEELDGDQYLSDVLDWPTPVDMYLESYYEN